MVSRASAVMPAAHPGLEQSAARQCIAHDGEQQGQQSQYREQQRQEHIQPISGFLHMEEAPAPGALNLVGPPKQHRQHSHQGSKQPGESQQPFHMVGSQCCGVEDRSGDSNAAFHRHGTPQEQGAQAEEHHACPKDAAHDAVRVKSLPILVGAVDKKHQGAVDEVTQQVCDHQAASKQKEGCLRLDPDSVVGLEKDEKGKAVGEDAHSHGDGGGGDRQLPLAAGVVAGSDF